ncbi:PIN domain-containing protein [Conexibacter arvalis]|uniref:Ribonuclease VapC n=1 Tax=Conexibacter arvalis TaxID=912552 RepID=A0A840IJK3_9ACTN|nr:putative nucleic acid-binding protein [Conexibacter arvalis]
MTACVLDTDVVIAALDRRDAHHERAAAALLGMVEADTPRLLSTINYAEALVRPAEDERTLRQAVDAIASLGVRLLAPTPEIARAAARNRALAISLADGFALATAQTHGAAIATFDRRARRAAERLGVALAL